MKYTLPIIFAIGTAVCWGMYGPTIANARDTPKPGQAPRWSAFKPYVFIGVAYLVIAVGGGALGMQVKGDNYEFFSGEETAATTWGFLAGTLGALGAFSLTSAMLSFDGKPKPELVMPIVFGGAVSITALVSVLQSKSLASANPLLWVGMLLVVVGVVMVASFTPHGGPGHGKKEGESHAAAPAETPAETADHAG